MELYKNDTYQKTIRAAAELPLPWELLEGKSLVIAGATGLIGRCLIDLLMYKNRTDGLGCCIYAISRHEESARKRLPGLYFDSEYFRFLEHDICCSFKEEGIPCVDYVLNLASNTHPKAYAEEPIGTVITNIYGTKNLLDFSVAHAAKRFVFLSSVEIYGENRGDVEQFAEDYTGILNPNTMRAGYPESKRCCEALCQAYAAEKDLNIVIPRLPRVYGPTMLEGDSKAAAQFITKAIRKENIVLKSEGKQYYSFLHVIDAVSGIMTVLLLGRRGEAYNVADEENDARLREIAELAAEMAGTAVVYELPDEKERRGYSIATKARLNGKKIRGLGWKPLFTAEKGIQNTYAVLSEVKSTG